MNETKSEDCHGKHKNRNEMNNEQAWPIFKILL